MRAVPDPEGRLADNIVYFCRALRHAGVKLGPSKVTDAIGAVLNCGIGNRDDFYWTLHCVLISRHEDAAVFDETFRLFWRSRELVEKMIQMFSPVAPGNAERQKARAGESRVAEALFQDRQRETQVNSVPEIEVDATLTFSDREVLRQKDFAQMSAAELARAKRAIAELALPSDQLVTRRFRPSNHGGMMDVRSMLRDTVKMGGDMVLPRYRTRRVIHPPLVVLADISGSMSNYSRVFLHFMHALAEKRRRVHAFVFGTRLTNLTRQIKQRDPDEALAQCSGAVADWSGGTRIGDAIGEFNRLWSRRVLGQGAVVVLITDGLERDDTQGLGREMERLHKSCRRLIWLNPLLRFEGFEPRARGVQAMLPHVDDFRAAHNLSALSDLCEALSANNRAASIDPKRLLAREAENAKLRGQAKPIVELGV